MMRTHGSLPQPPGRHGTAGQNQQRRPEGGPGADRRGAEEWSAGRGGGDAQHEGREQERDGGAQADPLEAPHEEGSLRPLARCELQRPCGQLDQGDERGGEEDDAARCLGVQEVADAGHGILRGSTTTRCRPGFPALRGPG